MMFLARYSSFYYQLLHMHAFVSLWIGTIFSFMSVCPGSPLRY